MYTAAVYRWKIHVQSFLFFQNVAEYKHLDGEKKDSLQSNVAFL